MTSLIKSIFSRVDDQIKLHRHRISSFKAHVELQFERGDYLVKTVTDGDELKECLQLRFEVFHREYMKKEQLTGIDIDRFDFICDHLVIVDKKADKIVGTYRLNSSLFNSSFYSESEFNIASLLQMPGTKLEMGRACIAKEYRNGVVMALLWRGIAEYIQRTETKIVFGCASVKTTSEFDAVLLFKYLKEKQLVWEMPLIAPTSKFTFPTFWKTLDYIENSPAAFNAEAAKELVPSLFGAYFKAGAKVCGEPALDKDFHCIDFLTFMKLDELNPLYTKKYKV